MDRHVDVVVLGAGTAGANVAYQFATRGRSVVLLERRDVSAAGAQWVNGVLDWQFARAGLDAPAGPERHRAWVRTHLFAALEPTGVTLEASPTVAADMGRLGERLRRLGADSGVDIIDRVGIDDVSADHHGRLASLTLRTASGPRRKLSAALFVDASGRTGALRRHSADLAPWCPPLASDELCSASDAHHRIADPAGAKAFLERHGAQLGDTVTKVGTNGGFSTCAVSISPDLSEVGILVGCLADGRYSTGPRMVAELCAAEPWIGEQLSIGSGVIPLRRPYARLTAPGLALVGDAACQVFSAHGSGIGIGLIAGTMLAQGVASVDDPGDAHELWARYQAPFHHEFGGLLAAYDVLRRLTTRLGEDGVAELMRAGITSASTLEAGLDQRWATPEPVDTLRALRGLTLAPTLAADVIPALLRAQLALAHGATHPASIDLVALDRWERRNERLVS